MPEEETITRVSKDLTDEERRAEAKRRSDARKGIVAETGVTTTPLQDLSIGLSEGQNITQTDLTGPTVLSSENGRATIDQIEEDVLITPEDTTPPPEPPSTEDLLLQAEADAGKDEATRRFEAREKEVNDFLIQQQANLSTSRQRQLSNIAAQFGSFGKKLEASTKRRVRLQETIGARFGGRFTIEHTADLVKDQIDKGFDALRDLGIQEQAAIGKIEDAFDSKSHALALKAFGALQALKEQKLKKFDEIEKLQQDALKLQQEEEKKLDQQELIAEQLEAGLTSPVKIFSALGGEVSFDAITAITKELGLDKDADKKFISGTKTQGAGVFDPNTGVFKPLRAAIGVGGGEVGSSGLSFPTDADIKNMSAEARDFVTKVMRQLPTKLKDSEQEKKERQKEALFDFNRGRKIQEVVDEINGFIIQNKEDEGIAKVFRRLSIGTGLELNEISAALNNNDPVKAMTTVENANLEKAEGELSEVVSAQSIIKNANRVLDLLKDVPSDKLGKFDAISLKFEKIGGFTDDEVLKTQQLETALTNLLNEIRRKSLGTAVTESEVAFLEPILASIADQPNIIETKIDELIVGTMNNHNRARSVTGLPEVTQSQLLNNDERLLLYESLAEELITDSFSGVSNQDLFNDILGNASSSPDTGTQDNVDFFNNLQPQ